MAVIRFVLRDEYDIRFVIQLFEVGDTRSYLLMRDRKDGIKDDGWANEPGVDQDCERSWKESRRRQWGYRGTEREQKGRITIQRLHCQGHRSSLMESIQAKPGNSMEEVGRDGRADLLPRRELNRHHQLIRERHKKVLRLHLPCVP